MLPPWENGPERIDQLLGVRDEARELLWFYQSLLVFQKSLFELLDEANLTGSVARDMRNLVDHLGIFFTWVTENGSTQLRSQAHEMIRWERQRQESLLLAYWRNEEIAGGNFFPKAFLQPYAAHLVQRQITIADRQRSNSGCSACGAPPQLSYLQSPSSNTGAASEGAGRHLLCSLCFSQWPINRICCFHCNEHNPDKLPYYQSESLPTARIEACDTCRHYIKGIDLTKDARAVPLVDEIATPVLDLWAQENGYTKVELNLAGI
jgi:FdhE protein